MKTAKFPLLVAALLAALAATAAPQQTTRTMKTFTTADPAISKDLAITEDKAWLADCKKPETIRLFEVEKPEAEQCLVTYRAKLKTENLTGKAYLEMWCRFPGKGEFFSRGLDNAVAGPNEWVPCQTPFFLKAGEKPDLVRLNLVVEGRGKVWIKDITLAKAPSG